VPYFLLSFAGLVISTFAVHLASDATTDTTRLFHTAAVEMANVAAYGTLWIVQFVLCDRILFRADGGASHSGIRAGENGDTQRLDDAPARTLVASRSGM
jgi:putative flippase GtrA